jgi:tripartite motif-containing protein 71
MYVSDFYNNRIKKFNSNGAFITKWGSKGTADGQFEYPSGVAVDSSENVYVADTGNHRIQVFSPLSG